MKLSPQISGSVAVLPLCAGPRVGVALLAAVAILLFPILFSHAVACQDDPASVSASLPEMTKKSLPAAVSLDREVAETSQALGSGPAENFNTLHSTVFISKIALKRFLLVRSLPGRSPPAV